MRLADSRSYSYIRWGDVQKGNLGALEDFQIPHNGKNFLFAICHFILLVDY